MKTTKTMLSLEEDVFKAIKHLARRQHLTLGEVASGLLRHALSPVKPHAPKRLRRTPVAPRARA